MKTTHREFLQSRMSPEGVPFVAQWVKNLRSTCEVAGSIPGLVLCVKELVLLQAAHRLQMWLRSGVAVAVAQVHSCNSNWTPSPGTSICCRCGYLKKKKERERAWQDVNIYLASAQGSTNFCARLHFLLLGLCVRFKLILFFK